MKQTQIKKTLQPGTWVRFAGDYDQRMIHLIVHLAPYVRENEENYFIYSFYPKGTYKDAGWVDRKDIVKINPPAFSDEIIVVPEMCVPFSKHDKAEGIFRGGMIYRKRNLVVIDTMVLKSKVLTSYLVQNFRNQYTWTSKNAWETDGAVFPKNFKMPA